MSAELVAPSGAPLPISRTTAYPAPQTIRAAKLWPAKSCPKPAGIQPNGTGHCGVMIFSSRFARPESTDPARLEAPPQTRKSETTTAENCRSMEADHEAAVSHAHISVHARRSDACRAGARTAALARGRRDRHGEHARTRDLAALRAASRHPNAKSYELSYLRSNTMPQSPFAVPLKENAKPTVGIQGTRHAFNTDEVASGDPGQQGTQMDALGHFSVLPEPWDGKPRFPPPREVLRRLYAAAGEADARRAVAEARHRQGAADRNHRRAARCQDLSRQGQARSSRAPSSRPPTSKAC